MFFIKRIFKGLIFIIILLLISKNVIYILYPAKTSIDYFYEEQKNTLDVVYIGGSNANTAFNTTLAYNEYGFTTGMLSTEEQSMVLTKYLMIESEKYQSPSLYVVDIAKFGEDLDELKPLYRKTLDSMNFSKNKREAITKQLKYVESGDKEFLSLCFPFLLYHNNWEYINLANFKKEYNSWDRYYKGYMLNDLTMKITPQEEYIWSNEHEELSESVIEEVNDLINYIKVNELNVLFVIPKRNKWWTNEKINAIVKMFDEHDLKTINFNTLDDFDVDLNTDYYDALHFNPIGSTRYTLWFSKYLKENYKLSDHRGDVNYKSWDESYIEFKEAYNDLANEEFDDLLNRVK